MISDRMPAIKKSSPDTTHINRHLHALDGLRGVAALCVLFLHSAELLKFTYVPPSAGLAVDFFFLLSGYVLAFAYDQKLEAKDYSFVWFAKLRLIRLYPMLFLGTSLGVAVAILGHTPASPLLIIGSFLLFPVGFISAIQNPQAYPYNNPVWSLFFELAVNFIYGSRLGRCAMPILFSIVAASAVGEFVPVDRLRKPSTVRRRGITCLLFILAWRGAVSPGLIGQDATYPVVAGISCAARRIADPNFGFGL
jgi:peptidoglycan/LPS O-acetylase OafA/YrhL